MKDASLGFTASLRIMGETLRLWWSDWANLVLVCLATILLSLTVVAYPAALFGVYEVCKDLSHGTRTGLGGFWGGFKRHFKQASLWGLVNTAVLAILGFNLWFYINSSLSAAPVLVIVTGLALVIWLLWQFYALAAYFLQEPQTAKLAWKNGWALLLGRPGFSLPIAVAATLVFGLSLRYFIPLAFGIPALYSLAGILAVQAYITRSKDNGL